MKGVVCKGFMEPDLQRINAKLMADAGANLNIDSILAIFGRWRQDRDHPSDWVDLADYAHMAKGQGILLVGKQGNFAVDLTDPGPGLLYCGKKDFEGPVVDRVLEAMRRCLALAVPLVAEPEYPADLKPQPGSWELTVNDRLDFPNTGETDKQLGPSIKSVLDSVFGSGNYTAEREPDPQRRYAYSVRTEWPAGVKELLEKVTGVADSVAE